MPHSSGIRWRRKSPALQILALSESHLTFLLPISYPASTSSLDIPLSTPHLLPLRTQPEESERKRWGRGSFQHKPRSPDAPEGPWRSLEWGWGSTWKRVQGPQPHVFPLFPWEDGVSWQWSGCPVPPGSPPQPGPRPPLPPAGFGTYI